MRENPFGGEAVMPMKRYKPEPIVTMLRQIEVSIANGKNNPPSLQGSRDHGADVLPLAQGIRRSEDGTGESPHFVSMSRTGEMILLFLTTG
jgi:hypothetical protein